MTTETDLYITSLMAICGSQVAKDTMRIEGQFLSLFFVIKLEKVGVHATQSHSKPYTPRYAMVGYNYTLFIRGCQSACRCLYFRRCKIRGITILSITCNGNYQVVLQCGASRHLCQRVQLVPIETHNKPVTAF